MSDFEHDPDSPPRSLTSLLKDPPTSPCRPPPSTPPEDLTDGVFVVWNVDKRRPFLKVCHASRDQAEEFMDDLLLPYPPGSTWHRRLRVAGPMPKQKSWKQRRN